MKAAYNSPNNNYVKIKFYSVLVFYLLFFSETLIVSVLGTDNYALMSGALRTFQAHSCDKQQLKISCPNDTVIEINFAQYGRASSQGVLCPSRQSDRRKRRRRNAENITPCTHNALKVLVSRCKESKECSLHTSPAVFGEDPCPGIRKYAEVTYKCRPYQFSNRVVCYGEQMLLQCNDPLKILVLSATFGSTEKGVLECPQTANAEKKDCTSSNATETVIRICSSKSRCSLTASEVMFGNPRCSPSVQKFLKVKYTCIIPKVLKPELLNKEFSSTESSKEIINVYTTSYPAWAGRMDNPLVSHVHTYEIGKTPSINSSKIEMQRDDISIERTNGKGSDNRKIVAFITELVSANKYAKGNKEQLILYVSLCVGIGFILFVVTTAAYFYFARIFNKKEEKDSPPVDCEDNFFSDSDLEQFQPVDIPPSHMNIMIRRTSDANPRTPLNTGSSNHYYC